MDMMRSFHLSLTLELFCPVKRAAASIPNSTAQSALEHVGATAPVEMLTKPS